MKERTNITIIGSGVAALQLAKKLRRDMNVTILTKSEVLNGNSALAQGGVAVALSETDDPYKHYIDTVKAGRNHNDEQAVLAMTKAAPALIKELHRDGCPFDIEETTSRLRLGMEGAHSERRIVHGGGDTTGKRMMDFLVDEIKAIEGITVIENITVFELMVENNQCIGVKGKNKGGQVSYFYSDHVVLATGGIGQLYSFTPCADTITGDGIALAYRAGAEITDMEFVQFHPTLLYINGRGYGLISEAVRGEGAKLITEDGMKIMEGVHPLKDLAPRHVVAQTIYDYLNRGHQVYLDISEVNQFAERFPTIAGMCKQNYINLSKGMLPVVPGCHFLMGGVKTDIHGKTSVEGLYAIGEVARTGVHGANRLASNSLLEGLFFGKNLADWLNNQSYEKTCRASHKGEKRKETVPQILSFPTVSQLKKTMMDRVGIVRTEENLKKQIKWLQSFHIKKWIETDLEHLSVEQIQMVFMLITSFLITDSALERTESRGGHFRSDYPVEDDHNWLKKQIIYKRIVAKDGRDEQIKTAATT